MRPEIPSLWSVFSSHHRQASALVMVSSDQTCTVMLPYKLQPKKGEGGERKRNKTKERVTANNMVLYLSQAKMAWIFPSSPY